MANDNDEIRRMALEMAMSTFHAGIVNDPLLLAKRYAFFDRVIRINNGTTGKPDEAKGEFERLAELFAI